jgi:antitoxin component YwqK of YwqJK toxin-antitoxin module
MKTKTIPFNLEMAKYIQDGKIAGKIITEHGDSARVICWDRSDKTHPIIALVQNKAEGIEESVYYTNEGKVFEDKYNLADLHIEVPASIWCM